MITLFCLAFANFIRLRLKRKNDDALLKAMPAYIPQKGCLSGKTLYRIPYRLFIINT